MLQEIVCTMSQKTSSVNYYNLDMHNPIRTICSRNVTEKVINQTMLCFPTSPLYCFCITLRNRKPRRQRTGALCVQRCNTVQLLQRCGLRLS